MLCEASVSSESSFLTYCGFIIASSSVIARFLAVTIVITIRNTAIQFNY